MKKVMLFAKRDSGKTLEAFRHWYETSHAPLVLSELPQIKRYVRNYIRPAPGMPEPEFDVVTEFWVDELADWKSAARHMADPVTGRPIMEDAAGFMNMATTRTFYVDEEVSDVEATARSRPA